MARRWCFALVGGAAVLATAALARAADPTAPVIWYRSSEGCPDGAAFVARLSGRAPGARLAEVNDRIDFVVTLGRSGPKSSGKLERQTAGSTVAIREIEAESCESVADVLAFTLVLSLNPAAEGALPPPPPAESSPVAPPPATPAIARSEIPPVAATGETPVDSAGSEPRTRTPRAGWLLGVDVGALTGPTGAVGPWLGAFGERRLGLAALPRSSVRLTALLSRVEDEQAELAFSTGAGRLEACPVAVGSPALEVRPCLGFEAGFAVAEGLSAEGRDDSGAWLAGNLLGRLSWSATPAFAFALETGATAPFVRYTFTSESGESSYRSDLVGFFVGVGAALVLE